MLLEFSILGAEEPDSSCAVLDDVILCSIGEEHKFSEGLIICLEICGQVTHDTKLLSRLPSLVAVSLVNFS